MHSDALECVLCEYVFNDTESLELHTFTCEAYMCAMCKLNMKTLSILRKHITEIHKGKTTNIFHVKQDRKNKEELCYTHHKSDELFPEMNI